MRYILNAVVFIAILTPVALRAQASSPTSEHPFVVEYYYKTKWGHADEFLKLFKKNHYPLLKKEIEMGRMVKVWMDQPRYHTTEDGRWDFRVTIVFKDATIANEPFDEDALKKIQTEPKNALVKQYQRLFEMESTDLTFQDEALNVVAKKAIERRTGARGLRH